MHDTSAAERVASVAGRARVVRRQRAAGVAAAAVLAVGGASAIAALPGGGDLVPAQAPHTLTSLGWSYEHVDTFRSESGEVSTELEPSDLPRLVSWATTGGEQDVVVRLQGSEAWAAGTGDYGDFVWVPPGFGGRVTVSGPTGLALATYDLDPSRTPAGVGDGVSILRQDVAGYDQVGAAIGDPGQASLEVPLDADPGELQLGYSCPGLPEKGYVVHVGVVGEAGSLSSEGACSYGGGFDPGGSTNVGFPGRWGPGSALRIWVTHQGAPVDDGELADLRLSLAAYAYAEGSLRLAGNEFPRSVEYGGKVFEVVDSVETPAGELPRLSVPEDGDHVVASWLVANPQTPYNVRVGGTTDQQTRVSGIGGSGSGVVLVRPDADEVSLVVGGNYVEDVTKAALVLYRRVE